MWRWARSTQRSRLRSGGACFKRLGDSTGSEIGSAVGLIAQSRIDRAWIGEQAEGSDRVC